MFHQRDYVLRLIEEAVRFLIRLRNRLLGREEDVEELVQALEDIALKVGLDPDVARMLAPESLDVFIVTGGRLDKGKCWLLGELFYLDACRAKKSGEAAALASSTEKAQRMFAKLAPDWAPIPGFRTPAERLEELAG